MGKSLVPFPMPDWSPSSSFPAPQSQPSTPITTPALSVGTLAWGQHFGDTGTMYGNLESSQAGQGQVSVLGPGREACSTLCPTEENLYEPLDPTSTVPGQKHVPDPASRCCSGKKLVLVGAAVLGVSVLMNILFLTIGSQRTPGHPVPCGDPPVSPCPPAVTALTSALEAEKEKQLSNVASRSFLLYNEDHRKCVAASGHQLIATACQPEAAAQQFQWLQGGQLQGWQSQRCVTATRGQNRAFVRLEPCRADGRLQRWECRDGGLLALAGYNLYFNYGNNQEQVVMLYTGNRQWSRWVIHGSQDNVCSRSCCPPCSKGWTYFRNSCYFYSKTPSSWENAQRFCSVLGTQLLEVDGAEEKDHIQTMLKSSSWLGIRDEEVEGTWKRANGTILPRESSWWHRNEPNGGHQENCAAVREDGEWYDYPCTSQLPWVCEGHP
ncbi:macrophage mannose receptor 1-like isoform X4 [Falco cherrug]|uniref:macrophage mannose receptor 1-like isoform X4 n=2 Tax=Falco TaxID=8952 RepID=UPI002479B812|nr:macrophage mannose receptor 1-like isoform X4 [Falco cherrug]